MSWQIFIDGYLQSCQLTLHAMNRGNEGASPLVLLHHALRQQPIPHLGYFRVPHEHRIMDCGPGRVRARRQKFRRILPDIRMASIQGTGQVITHDQLHELKTQSTDS